MHEESGFSCLFQLLLRGSPAGIRTPIRSSRGCSPTVERPGCARILNHFAGTAKPHTPGCRIADRFDGYKQSPPDRS